MFLAGLDDAGHLSHRLFKFAGELVLLFVTPGLLQLIHLRRQRCRLLAQVLAEPVQRRCELAKVIRVDNGLAHDGLVGFGKTDVGNGLTRLLGVLQRRAIVFGGLGNAQTFGIVDQELQRDRANSRWRGHGAA